MTPDKKSKADYGFTPINVRGDRKYVNYLKNLANNEDIPLADYVRELLDSAIACKTGSFFAESGNDTNQSGKA